MLGCRDGWWIINLVAKSLPKDWSLSHTSELFWGKTESCWFWRSTPADLKCLSHGLFTIYACFLCFYEIHWFLVSQGMCQPDLGTSITIFNEERGLTEVISLVYSPQYLADHHSLILDTEQMIPTLPIDESVFFIMCKEICRPGCSSFRVKTDHPSSN